MAKTKLKGKKKLMYEALKKTLGNVTLACEQVGIDRSTHYRWLKKYPVYKKMIDEIEDITIDFAENALFRQIKEGNTTAIIFYLKTKGKHRGYIERQEIDTKVIQPDLSFEDFYNAYEEAKSERNSKEPD